jgi:hypothetical protein
MPHPSILNNLARTGVHIDISNENHHPNALTELLRIVVSSGGHLTIKGGHPDICQELALIGGKHLTIKF